MKLTILGCGTSTGVPIPGCSCAVCTSTDTRNSRTRTSALLTHKRSSILIDAGIDLRQQALREKINSIDAVLYTHAHSDHILGTDDLRVFNFKKKEPIPCYGTKATLQGVQQTFPYIFSPESNYQGGMLPKLTLNEIEPLKGFETEGIRILPFEMEHGSVTVTGFRIEDLVYATDCKKIPTESKDIMHDAEVLVLDGLRFEEHNTHLTIDEAIALSEELHAKQTYLVHMTHTIDYATVNALLPETVALAYDGLQIEL